MSEWIQLCAQGESTAEAAMDWGIIGSTVVTGIAVVFLILAILVGFLSLMGYILGSGRKKAPADSAAPAPAAPAPAAAVISEIEEDDTEVIAVISAAVAAYGEAEGKQYRIRSVRRRDKAVRSGWSAAGVAENTRGF